jgi:N-acyl-D-amino-acid deacylase
MNRRIAMLIGATLLGFLITASHAAFAQSDSPQYDLIIWHGIVYDGTGAGAVIQDIAVQGGRIAALGDLSRATL